MATEIKPYIVSSDVKGLMAQWGRDTGYQLPPEDFFHGITRDLQNTLEGYFPASVEMVDEQELRHGLNNLAAQRIVSPYQRIPIISLDRAYVDRTTPNIYGYLDITRGVDDGLTGIGLKPRPGKDSVEIQLDRFASKHNLPVILLDDVVFSGEGMCWLVNQLAERGRPVVKVITGIGIRTLDGDPAGITQLRDLGIEVECVREFETVVDEVCQRDFVAGTPMSGRSVYSSNGAISSAPYFAPFGDAAKWASIPDEKVDEFSEFCMETSIEVFRRIEDRSQASVPTSAIDRLPRGLRPNNSFINALQETKETVR